MARMRSRNTFGSQNSKLDLQRSDLFKVSIELPAALGLPWDEHVEFAVESFPFPDRSVEAITVKYMQQTNNLIGADTPMPAIDMKVRYAFAQRTAEALEKWTYLVRNPQTGGVGLTSEVKSKGYFRWLIPNMRKQIADIRGQPTPSEDTLRDGLVYQLEGCWPKNFKYLDADHTQSAYVTCTFSLQIDRYYPDNLDRMQIVT